MKRSLIDRMFFLGRTWMTVSVMVLPAMVLAEDKPSPAKTPESATVEAIMRQAVANIGRRYNLNEAQMEKTHEIMERDVLRFLSEHEGVVWPLIRDLLSAQLGAKPPSEMEEVKRIGKSAEPLVKLAKEAILRGNDEWRMYLTPEQRKVHDYDLAEMDKSFGEIERNFKRWSEGKPGDSPLFPAPPAVDRSPVTPTKPPGGLPSPRVEVFNPHGMFDTFVEEFIKEYELDKGQIDSARSIMTEFKAAAVDFKIANRQEFEKIAADLAEAREKGDRKKLVQSEAARKELLQPVYEQFGKLDERLKALLTTAQIERHASANPAADRTPEVERVTKRTNAPQITPKAEPPKEDAKADAEPNAD